LRQLADPQAELQAKDWEKNIDGQEKLHELVANSPRAKEHVKAPIDIAYQRSGPDGFPGLRSDGDKQD